MKKLFEGGLVDCSGLKVVWDQKLWWILMLKLLDFWLLVVVVGVLVMVYLVLFLLLICEKVVYRVVCLDRLQMQLIVNSLVLFMLLIDLVVVLVLELVYDVCRVFWFRFQVRVVVSVLILVELVLVVVYIRVGLMLLKLYELVMFWILYLVFMLVLEQVVDKCIGLFLQFR